MRTIVSAIPVTCPFEKGKRTHVMYGPSSLKPSRASGREAGQRWRLGKKKETRTVASNSNTGDDGELATAMLLARNPLRLLHQQRTDPLVLEESRITSMHGDGRSVNWE
jgi:hypothetical protein